MTDKDSILLENIYNGILLNEVKWDTQFSDTSKTCYSPEDVADALNKELERLKIPSTKRPPSPKNFPKISKGNIPLDEQGKIQIDHFRRQITKMPKTIFDMGEKSLHTTDDNIKTVNTGIPALRAVLWDEDEEKFYVINTCPGAGSCPVNCYAMQGFYIMNDGKNLKLVNRLQLMMNHPDMYTKMAYKELELFAFEANREDKQLKIRWNDAGDFFSETYFKIAIDITKTLLDKGYNVESYAYTKIAKFYKMGEEAGMVMNFSEGAKGSERTDVGDLQNIKMSIIVPTQVFEGYFEKKGPHIQKDDTGKSKFKTPEHKQLLKEKIVNYYNMHPDPKYGYINNQLHVNNTFYTDELPNTLGEKGAYNCIVLPNGDSDRPAQRKDVRYTLLLEH